MRPTDWSLYRDTGVSHLLSVSGLHVTMFSWLAGLLGGRLWRRSSWLCLHCPAPRAAMWIGTVAAGLYAVFSGWGVPAQRTFGLVLTLSVLRQVGVRWPWGLSLAVAALAVGLMDPWALTQPGFWLSFCAVALLMASGVPAEPGLSGALASTVRAQWTITLGLAPLTLLLFQQLSIIGLLANAVAIPWVSYVITPMAMLGAVWAPLWTVGAWMVAGLHAFLEALRGLPLAVWHLPWAPVWAQALGLVGGVIAALPWAWTWRLCGVALALPLLWPQTPRPPPGVLELWVPDVGQGGAAVLRTHRHTLLFDAGPRWGPGADAGDRVLLPLLRGLGDRRVDLLMVSHADQDHAGGAASVLDGLPVARRRGAVRGAQPCVRGEAWTWDGVRFEVLSPEAGEADEATDRRRNGSSCVLMAEAGGRRVLLTGDIDIARERRLLRLYGDGQGAGELSERRADADGRAVDGPVGDEADEGDEAVPSGLRAEVMVVPHHGSKTSSSLAFVRAVGPRVAVAQSGYLNRFGHPREEVVARYRALGTTWLNTVDCGAWQWRSDGPLATQAPELGCERSRRRRYWLRPPMALVDAEDGDEVTEDVNLESNDSHDVSTCDRCLLFAGAGRPSDGRSRPGGSP
ncbi:DNA internalization-related competence protein ComEC/Rec2 [Roseateles amylovorans]|uniref:DNA internalization-related competence protein ComEC/Rec2 n=1 Tax=Roseateles amylovorans TaxID=2978473 RepID=A0ABY6B837_9BURK|nr:DNA internalization-related competence protein ComEC/Rec2 [Roseateles amylovorans]UXH80106.1 DNA internalization-related competence protein ComEC/Rec2 [Roseateles amylovorans]